MSEQSYWWFAYQACDGMRNVAVSHFNTREEVDKAREAQKRYSHPNDKISPPFRAPDEATAREYAITYLK